VTVAKDIITDAHRLIEVVGVEDELDGAQSQQGLRTLISMLKAWQGMGFYLWTVTTNRLNLSTANFATLGTYNPYKIQSVRYKENGLETPMQEMTRQEWDELPDKLTKGIPTMWYADYQLPRPKIHFWPSLATAPTVVGSQTLEITYERDIKAPNFWDTVDVPSEYEEAVLYGLADRLQDIYGRGNDRITARAQVALGLAMASDREGSVFFCGDEYRDGWGYGRW
jgi:hypothetical protein